MPLFGSRKDKNWDPQRNERQDATSVPETSQAPRRTLPPHMQRIIDERSAPRLRPDASVEEQRDAYERRRMAIQFDIDQGELANSPDNPWSHRIELLTEALADVEQELREVDQVTPGPYHPVPTTPIKDIDVAKGEGVSISFHIGNERFVFEEVLDWAERGTQVARPELVQMSGSAGTLVPNDTPEELREPLARHLQDSVVALATDLRDRTLDDEPQPENPTLADLAKPCPACGGWTDWQGHCATCAARKARSLQLFQERKHLLAERSNEAEERHRLAERLPLARHRMKDLEREIAAWEKANS